MYSAVAYGRFVVTRFSRTCTWKCRFHTTAFQPRAKRREVVSEYEGKNNQNQPEINISQIFKKEGIENRLQQVTKNDRNKQGRIVAKQAFVEEVVDFTNDQSKTGVNSDTSDDDEELPRQKVKQIRAEVEQLSLSKDHMAEEQRIRNLIKENVGQFSSIEQLLSETENWSDLSTAELVLIFNRIAELCTKPSGRDKSLGRRQLIRDERFKVLEKSLKKKPLHMLPVGLMVGSRLSLMKLKGLESLIVQSLEKPIMDRLSVMHFPLLFRLLRQEEEFKTDLSNKALKCMRNRWAEIQKPEQLIFIMERDDRSSTNLTINLQEVALTLTDHMSVNQRFQILHLLSKTGQRNVPLIRNLVYYFSRGAGFLQIDKLGHLLYYLSNLYFYDKGLLKTLSTRIIQCLQQSSVQVPNTKILASILFSLNVLMYRDTDLTDNILDLIFTKPSSLDEDSFVATLDLDSVSSVILSCALLGYFPEKRRKDIITQKCVKRIQNCPEIVAKPSNWLNTVWALTVLELANTELVASVLNEAFYTNLVTGEDSYILSSFLKLQDVNLSAKYEIKDYSEPLLPVNFINDYITKIKGKTKRPLFDNIVNELKEYVDENVHFETNFRHPEGIIVDIQMIVNEKGDPQRVADYPLNKSLPENFHRIAVKPLEFADTMRGTPGLSGIQSIQLRQLSFLGYSIVQIPYTEWNELASAKRIEYLNKKINESIS